VAAHVALLKAVSMGRLAPDEGAQISTMISSYLKTIETTEHAARLDALERKAGLRT
jgi:hypothetical protein